LPAQVSVYRYEPSDVSKVVIAAENDTISEPGEGEPGD